LSTAPLTPHRVGLKLDLERNYKMKKLFSVVFLCFAVAVWAAEKSANEWAMNASIIEACSCPMFCQCYFNSGTRNPIDIYAQPLHWRYCIGKVNASSSDASPTAAGTLHPESSTRVIDLS
jgi:hypothetical protein